MFDGQSGGVLVSRSNAVSPPKTAGASFPKPGQWDGKQVEEATVSGDTARVIDVVPRDYKKYRSSLEEAKDGEEAKRTHYDEPRRQSGCHPVHHARNLVARPVGVAGKSEKCDPEYHSSSRRGGPAGKADGRDGRASSMAEDTDRLKLLSDVREKVVAGELPLAWVVPKRHRSMTWRGW